MTIFFIALFVFITIIRSLNTVELLIDFDGTIANSDGDKIFKAHGIAYYMNNVGIIPLNHIRLITYILISYITGCKLTLFTMRSPDLAQLTKDNLGIYNYFFHNHYFGEGNKQQYLIDNPSTTFWVIDNEDKGYSAYDNVVGFTHVASWDTTPMTTPAAHTTTYIIAIITAITLMAVLTTGAIAAPQYKEDTCPIHQYHQYYLLPYSSAPTGAGTLEEVERISPLTTRSTGTKPTRCVSLSFPNREVAGSLRSMRVIAMSATSQRTLTMQVTYERSSGGWSTMKIMTWRQSLQERGESSSARSRLSTNGPLLYVGVVGLLILTLTMWVAVKRCPLLMKGGIMAIIALVLSLLVSTAAPGAVVDTQPTFEVVDVIDVESTQNEDTGMCPPTQTDSPFCPMTTVVGGMRVSVTRRNRKRLRALLGGKSPYRRVWSMMLCGGTYNVGYQSNSIEEASWMREACAEIVCAIGGDMIALAYESACQLAQKLMCVGMIGYYVYVAASILSFETEGAIAVASAQSILGWFALPNATSSGVLRQVTGGNSQTSSTLRVQYWVEDELKNITITSYGRCARDVLNEYLVCYKKIVANNNSGRKSLLESGGKENDIPEMSFSPEDFAIGRALRAGPIPEFKVGDPGFDPETAEGFVIETSAAGKFVCLDEVGGNYTRFDLKGDYFDDNRNIVDEWLGNSATLDVVTGEIAVVQGMSWEDIAKQWSINPFKDDGSYNEKWASKYTRKELLAHRMYAVELDPTMVEHRVLSMTDGFGMIEGPRELLMAMFPGVRIPGGVGFRMFDAECGLVKGRYRFKVNNTVDHVVIWSDPRNIKGTIFRKGGEGVLISYWEYSQRLKPATSGPQLLSQVQARNTAWARYFEEFAALNARASASRLLGAIKHGYLDSGLTGFESSDESRDKTIALIRRDKTVERMLELGLPIATSSTLVFLLGKLLKRWSVQKRHFNTAAQCWNIYLPHSASGIVMAKSSRELLGRVDRKIHDNNRVYWCPIYRELIIDDELYEKCDPNNDMGDEDGDMMFLWLVIMSGVLTVLLSRHPVGIGGFQFLKPEEVAVDYQFTSYKSSLGNEIDIPIAEIGEMPTSDKYKFESIEDLEDSTTPTQDSSWQEILEYEAAKRRNAVALGRAINNMTWRIGHGLPFTPIECQLIADASQSGGVNVATMKMLADIVTRGAKQRVNGQKHADRAMVAKFRMHKKCKKKGVAIVNGDFTKLIERSVKEHQACHQYIMTMVETKGTGMRNIEPLVALCTENGVTPNKERGDAMLGVTGRVITNFTYDANPGIIKAMRYLQRLDGHEAAEVVLGAIVSLHENGEYDHPIFSCYQDELPADLLQHNIVGYLTAYLQNKMAEDDDDPEGPNPDGDGPSTETQTETQTETTESQKSENMDEHTQFEVLDAMKMDELKQICRDSGLKGWSKLKKADLIQFIIDNTDDDNDDDDDNPTPPNGGGDGPDDDDDDDWMLLEQAAEDATNCGTSEEPETEAEAACRILNDFTVNEQAIIHDFAAYWYNDKFPENSKIFYVKDQEPQTGFAHQIDKMSFLNLTKAELIDFVDWFKNEHPDIFESINTAPVADEAGKKEDNMSKNKKTTLVKEWAEAGKKVQLKQNNQGIYFFVVDGGMRWIPQSVLSEEDSKDIQKVRALYGEAKRMMAQGVASTLFKSLGLAALLFAALFGLDAQEGSIHMCTSVCFLTQEWDKVRTRIIHAMKRLTGAERDYDRAVSEEYPEEIIQDRAGMMDLYQKELDKEMASLKEVEHAMDNQSLDEVHGKGWQSKQVKAKWPTKCGAQKHHWVATHPECRPGSCSRPMEPNIGRKAPLKVWWK